MELWKLFAKYGRVGEVYIPSKLDKRGNEVGFMKLTEVKSIEALSSKLQEVWIGTYKLRINLSEFGRNHSKTTKAQRNHNGALGGAQVGSSGSGTLAHFRSAVT
jgi:hypothetical protein